MQGCVELGAVVLAEGTTRFRVWAPERNRVELALESAPGSASGPGEGPGTPTFVPMARAAGGYFECTVAAGPGTRYRYRLDGGDTLPDPCSRSQPAGPHAASEVMDGRRYRWGDAGWKGLPLRGQVLYELHVGAFSPGGTYAGVIAALPQLKELGITVLELMPVNAFPGRFNWGYDGVSLYAPFAGYGTPDQLRTLVDACHAHGLGIILDVVYNHLGPDGNYLARFSPRYFTTRYQNDWGEPPNFEDPEALGAREFFIQNAVYWIDEFHFDGLRLDATQNIFDASARHVISELAERARAAAPDRELIFIAENEPQDGALVRPAERSGMGLDGLWVDDFHHACRVAAAGNREAYLTDYSGSARELLACALRNSLFQGQYYAWQKKPRGTPLRDIPPHQLIFFLQNHDQLANFLRGQRLQQLCGPMRMRALTTLFLLLPQTPMLFMGQEYFATTPFLFFVDHVPALQAQVDVGRGEFLAQFASARRAMEVEGFRTGNGEDSFRRSMLDPAERARNTEALALTRALLTLRRTDAHFAAQDRARLDGATLSEVALVLRWSGDEQTGDRLLLLNLGAEVQCTPNSEPLLAPPPGTRWRPVLSSEETRFGGQGACAPDGLGSWTLPGQCALVLTSEIAT